MIDTNEEGRNDRRQTDSWWERFLRWKGRKVEPRRCPWCGARIDESSSANEDFWPGEGENRQLA
jgi:hypothetical protein